MQKILIIFAHPALEKSRVHASLIAAVREVDGVTVNDLYQNYPEFDIDIETEQQLLLQHDIIIWQHPLYWYSSPALLKQWQDLVLEHGWAYGKNGNALAGKKIFNVFTSGGTQEAYQAEGFHHFTVHEFLRPFQKTAELCRMAYWPPYWIAGTHAMQREQISAHAASYRDLLQALVNEEISFHSVKQALYLNELMQPRKTVKL